MLDIAIEGVAGANPGEPVYFDNVGHPAASRLALAKASHGHMHGFGIAWDDTSGRNNGHFAPFAWSSNYTRRQTLSPRPGGYSSRVKVTSRTRTSPSARRH